MSYVTPLKTPHYCKTIYDHMVKYKLIMYIDSNNQLWHINDLKAVIKPQSKIAKVK